MSVLTTLSQQYPSVPTLTLAVSTVSSLHSLLASTPRADSNSIGYILNTVSKTTPALPLASACRQYGYLYRQTVEGQDIDKASIENDISNLHRINTCSLDAQKKSILAKRYLDTAMHMEDTALAFAECRCLKRSNELIPQGFETFPVAFCPAFIKKSVYDTAREETKIQNNLWMKLVYNPDFLLEQCKELEKDDDFVMRFTNIIRKVKDSKIKQGLKLAISRNDVMLQGDQFYQVEFNLIASSLGPISQRHSQALGRLNSIFGDSKEQEKLSEAQLSNNEEFLFKAMKDTYEAYGNPKAVIVMVARKEKNVFDQYAPQTLLLQAGINYRRYTFEELAELMEIDADTGVARVMGEEVCLFYFRDGYMPDQYTDKTWEVREKIELSKAVKCPDASLQLVNMKYFQYVLNNKAHWLKFGMSEEQFAICRKSFCDIFSLSDFGDDKAKMLSHIENNGGLDEWVLKPQREGGANNFFGQHIKEQIDKCSIEELKAFILMRKIHASVQMGIHCDWKSVRVREVIHEFGFFQYNLWRDNSPVSTAQGGTLVRTKINGVDEGGVGMGFAVINSVQLE